MPKREGVRQRLTREVQETKEQFKTEAAKFRAVVRDVPSGLPYPDSVTRVKIAAHDHNEALEAYKKAVARLNDYTQRDIIPVDLRELEETE